MKIPKKVIKGKIEYAFVSVVKDNMFLYENTKTKTKTTFSRHDLGLIDNKLIDEKLDLNKNWIGKPIAVVVYDRLYETETKYDAIKDAAEALGVTASEITKKIRKNEWLNSRWFIERVEMEDGQ